MTLSKNSKILLIVGVVVVVIAATIPAILVPLNNKNTINFTLIDNAGIMIESQGLRIYIDPINLDSNYENLEADAVLITHPHGDHYQASCINMVQKNGTINVFPENMTDEITLHDGVGVNPEDQIEIGHITITAYYMYTLPAGIYPASHPKENNWTSYIIDLGGFTIFHAGDSKNIPEYEDIVGTIDVALLPLGPGCQTMYDMEVIDVLRVIEPNCLVPIHYGDGIPDTFYSTYGHLIDCEYNHLEYGASCKFKMQ